MARPRHSAAWILMSLAAVVAAACGTPPPPRPRPPEPVAPGSGTATAAFAPPTPPALRLPTSVRPERYDVDLTIDPSKETFGGVLRADLALAEATRILWLNATGLTIKEARVEAAGQTLTARVDRGGDDFVGFTVDHAIGPGAARITIAYEGPLDRERSQGFYRVNEGAGPEDWYAYSIFEPIDARRAFPCFDEPSFKVPWKLTLHVKQGHVALSNARVIAEAPGPDGMKTVTFEETRPLPSYLIAMVVGPFDIVDAGTAGHHGTPLRFVVPKGRGAETRYAAEVTPKIVGLLEDYFGVPYPYGKLDVAVVPRSDGTLEHPGLLGLAQPLTLIKPAAETPLRKRQYANIAVHELAHYWLGDYVTMPWWDDTWVKEGLATWMDAKITQRLEPAWTYDLTFLERRLRVMSTDALSTARRVRQPVTSNDDIVGAYDNITYFKGGAVFGMFERFLGPDRFQKGIQRYLADHAWGNAAADDLIRALNADIGQDIGPALKTFLDEPGMPLITARLSCSEGAPPKLEVSQRRFIPAGSEVTAGASWQVPVCVRYGTKKGAGRACALLGAQPAAMKLDESLGCPDWVMSNEDASGYYRSSYSLEMLSRLFGKAGAGLTPAERLGLVSDTNALVDTGAIQLGDALGLLPAILKGADWHVLQIALHTMDNVRPEQLSAELRGKYAKLVRTLYGERARALGLRPKPGEDADAALLRPALIARVALDGDDPTLRREARAAALKWLTDRAAIDPDLLSVTLAIAAKGGDRALFGGLLAAARSTADRRERREILRALGAFRDPALTKEALALLLEVDIDLGDTLGILFEALADRETQEQAYAFLKAHFDALVARLNVFETRPLWAAVGSFCDEAHHADAATFFTERAKKIDGAPRALANELEEQALCIARHKLHQKSVEETLKKL